MSGPADAAGDQAWHDYLAALAVWVDALADWLATLDAGVEPGPTPVEPPRPTSPMPDGFGPDVTALAQRLDGLTELGQGLADEGRRLTLTEPTAEVSGRSFDARA